MVNSVECPLNRGFTVVTKQQNSLASRNVLFILTEIPTSFRACLHEGGGPKVGEVTWGGLPHLTCKRDHIKMRDYMDRRVTPPKRVTSPIWGTPPPCKQALSRAMFFFSTGTRIALRRPKMPRTRNKPKIETRNSPLFLRTTFFYLLIRFLYK